MIGYVESELRDRAAAPKQGDEGGPDAWLVIGDGLGDGVEGLAVDDDVFVFTWLHMSRRDVLRVHPRDDTSSPMRGVFTTRSAERPNPIGLHRVRVLELDGRRIRVSNLEALDGTPIVDIKPVLGDEGR